jgi:hypothetical protein
MVTHITEWTIVYKNKVGVKNLLKRYKEKFRPLPCIPNSLYVDINGINIHIKTDEGVAYIWKSDEKIKAKDLEKIGIRIGEDSKEVGI